MGTARDISEGLAQLIADSGIGVTFNASGLYADSATGVIFKVMPAKPDRVVVLAVVPLLDEVGMPLGQVMVQTRFRGVPNNPLDVDDLGDSVERKINGLKDLTFGETHIIQMNRRQSVPNGQDDLDRWERIDQYYLDVDTAATPLRPVGGDY